MWTFAKQDTWDTFYCLTERAWQIGEMDQNAREGLALPGSDWGTEYPDTNDIRAVIVQAQDALGRKLGCQSNTHTRYSI